MARCIAIRDLLPAILDGADSMVCLLPIVKPKTFFFFFVKSRYAKIFHIYIFRDFIMTNTIYLFYHFTFFPYVCIVCADLRGWGLRFLRDPEKNVKYMCKFQKKIIFLLSDPLKINTKYSSIF